VWRAPVTTDADVAARLLNLEDESVFEPSDRSCRFFEVLLERYPSPDVLTDRELEDGVTPWDDGPEGSERLVSLSLGGTRRGRRRDRRTRPERQGVTP
jgi:hypothetical protein